MYIVIAVASIEYCASVLECVRTSACACVCMCVCVYICLYVNTITQKIMSSLICNLTQGSKYLRHCPIKVKVTEQIPTFSTFTTIQCVKTFIQ